MSSPQDKVIDDLIAGLIRITTSLLPFSSKITTTSRIGDLRQNANSLIKLSKYKLDRVVEGLLHLQAELIKSYENAKQLESVSLSSNSHNSLTSSISSPTGASSPSSSTGGNAGSHNSINANNLNNSTSNNSDRNSSNNSANSSSNSSNSGNSATNSGSGLFDDPQNEDVLHSRYIRSKIIVFQLFVKTLSAAINHDKFDLRFENDFLNESLYGTGNKDDEDDGAQQETLEQLLKKQAEEKMSQHTIQISTTGDVDQLQFDTQSEMSDSTNPHASIDLTGSLMRAASSGNLFTATLGNHNAQQQQHSDADKFDESRLPKLDPSLTQSLLRYIIDTLWPSSDNTRDKDKGYLNERVLKHLAARALFKLSILSFDVVFAKVEDFFKNMKQDEVSIPIYSMLEYINFDRTKTSRLISLLVDSSSKFKKNAIVALAYPLRKAIWNYILNFPQQFISDCATKSPMPGNPIKLFQVIVEKKPKKTPSIWPLQTMILLLCPQALSDVIMLIKTGKTDNNYKKERKFLESLIKTLKTKGERVDYAVMCFVDLYKASTYLEKGVPHNLRLLIAQVQNIVLDRLFKNVESPVRTLDGKIDVTLMVDFLVSAYRINPRYVVSYIFPYCLRGTGLHKLVFAKGMLQLAQEGAVLPFHPTLSQCFAHIAKPVRLLFQDLLNEENQQQTLRASQQKEAASNPKAKKHQKDAEPSYCTETLLNLLAVFYTEPRLVLENTSGASHITDMMYLFASLTTCLGGANNVQIQNQAYRLLEKFFDVRYIIQWLPDDIVTGFTEISSSVMVKLAFILLNDVNIKGNDIKSILSLLKEITSSANKFIEQHRDNINEAHLKGRKRIEAIGGIESALLVMLCSTEHDVLTTAASCFGDLCNQIDILGAKEVKGHNSIALNYELYRKIASLPSNIKNSQDLRSEIFKLLRRVEVKSKANIAAFLDVNPRWKNYTKNIISAQFRMRDSKDDSAGSLKVMQKMWVNYTTFLCSICGCLLSSDNSYVKSRLNTREMTEDLVKELMPLLIADDPEMRTAVANIIGLHLSPAAYGLLFHNLHSIIGKFFGEEGAVKVSATSTLYVDMIMTIMKIIIMQAKENSADLALANFETLIYSFVQYCSQLVLNAENDFIKCKLCMMIDLVLEKREYITFSNEIQFKFQVLRSIVEWTSDFASKYKDNNGKKSDTVDPSITLDVLCMKVIAGLLKNLNLAKLKREKGSGKERNEANKKEFLKYFQFLSRNLLKSKDSMNSEASRKFREFNILALGNLLESNMSFGLEHFMKMAYDEDQETRSAFLSVLTKIMKQGIQLESETFTEPQEKYEKLMKLLMDNNLEMVFFILKSVSVSEQDDLCKAFVKLFAAQGDIIKLLKTAIDHEVEQTIQASTLFRANSSASKMLTSFCQMYGKDYMNEVLSSLVNGIIGNSSNYEIDPSKVSKDDDIEKNLANLMEMSQNFLDSIFNSVESCPMPIRVICNYLGSAVEAKFPSNTPDEENPDDAEEKGSEEDGQTNGHKRKYVAIGGLLFLRFLNPAIVAPKAYGIVTDQPNPQASRCLLLISKLVQNIANGVKFGGKQAYKEAFMKPLDPFVILNFTLSRNFYDKIAEVPLDTQIQESLPIEEEARIQNFLVLHRFLFNNIDKMQLKAQESERESVEKLASLVLELGRPPEIEKLITSSAPAHGEFSNPVFDNFMNQMKNRNIDMSAIEEKQFFFKSGVSKSQKPVVYFICRKFEGIDNDESHELAMYHVLSTLQSVFVKPFEILVDCTEFREDHGLQLAHLSKFFKFLPAGAKKNTSRIIVYNPNSFLKDSFSKTIQGKLLTRKSIKKLALCSSMKELKEYIDEKNLALPEDSYSFEKDVQTTFSPAWVVASHNHIKEASVKLSSNKVCIMTKKDTIFGLTARLVEFIDITKISARIEYNQNDNSLEQVVIEYDSPPSKIVLRTEANKQLVLNINAIIARLNNDNALTQSMSDNSAQDHNQMRQEDIPGSILNMCFLNLESRFSKTRSEAYNLLAALSEQFELPITMFEADNMCVPHNTSDLVVALSEQVARAKPIFTATFLSESLRGFNKVSLPYKFLCLKYMKPWISNLTPAYELAKKNGDTTMVERIIGWFPELTNSTVMFHDVCPAILSDIWGEISKDATLVRIAVDCILEASIKAGVGTTDSETLNDLIVTLASCNCADLVVDNIIDYTLNIINTEIVDADEPLEKNGPWMKIIHCCRFMLMLSFQNRINVIDNAPAIFYIISLTIGRGSNFVRSTMHALTLNVVHSLATALKFNREQKKLMASHLDTLTSPQFKSMFLGSSQESDPFSTKTYSNQGKTEPTMKIGNVEVLTHYFIEVMKTCSSVNSDVARWPIELSALYKSQSVLFSPIMLPRLLIAYGVLIKPGQEAQDTLNFVMECLLDSFGKYSPHRNDLAIASLLCLRQYCFKLSPDDPVLKKVLVIPIILLAAADPVLFPDVIRVLDNAITAISESKTFKECTSMGQYFNLHCRDEKTDLIITRFEKISGISFKANFSFALLTLLIKGLTIESTKRCTTEICSTLVAISTKLSNNVSEILGFLCALIPERYEDISKLMGVENYNMLTEDNFAHPYSALLFVRCLLTVAQNMQDETSSPLADRPEASIYKTLREAFKRVPEVFEPFYPDFMPRVVQVYTQTSSSQIAEVSLALINTMMTETGEAFSVKDNLDRLKDISFTGINRAGSFRMISDQTRTECFTMLIDFVKSSFDVSEKKQPPKKAQEVASPSK